MTRELTAEEKFDALLDEARFIGATQLGLLSDAMAAIMESKARHERELGKAVDRLSRIPI